MNTLPWRDVYSEGRALSAYYDGWDEDEDCINYIDLDADPDHKGYRRSGDSLWLPYEIKGEKIGALDFLGAYTKEPYRNLYLPETLVWIHGWGPIFHPDMETIHIPASTKRINSDAFYECKKLREIVLDEDNPYFEVHEGALYHLENKELILVPAALDADILKIKEGTRWIRKRAFDNCSKLKKIIFPASFERITGNGSGSYFAGCSELQEIVMPDNMLHAMKKVMKARFTRKDGKRCCSFRPLSKQRYCE